MCTWLHVYVATCINVYKGTGIWREFLHVSPNNPKCQGKRQDLRIHLFKCEPTLKSKACLKCLYFTIIIFDLCRYLEYFSYLCTINQTE